MDIKTVIDVAFNEIGYCEKNSCKDLDSKTANAGDGNYTKYWRDLKPSFQGQPWCNAFVNWCFVKAYGQDFAKNLLCTKGDWSYYTPTSADYFKRDLKWKSIPMTGDIIFFRNSSRIHHVGIVYKVESGVVYTVEGNTSDGKQVVANGGSVCAKSYSIYDTAIAGYGRPDYAGTNPSYRVGWHHTDKGFWYADTEKTYYRNRFAIIDGYRYYFDEEGYAVTGIREIDGNRYIFENTPGAPKECAEMRTGESGILIVKKYS